MITFATTRYLDFNCANRETDYPEAQGAFNVLMHDMRRWLLGGFLGLAPPS
jgi:hypothetical protein